MSTTSIYFAIVWNLLDDIVKQSLQRWWFCRDVLTVCTR